LAPLIRFKGAGGALVLVLAAVLAGADSRAATTSNDAIQLQLSPRICTLSANDKQCQTQVLASWRSSTPESLCLIVLEKPEVKRCWERYSEGTYSMELVFADDLTFQLRDPDMRQVLSSEVLQVIREAVRYRHKRREPWNVF
jgi:Protein of unknown function (DUF3019)